MPRHRATKYPLIANDKPVAGVAYPVTFYVNYGLRKELLAAATAVGKADLAHGLIAILKGWIEYEEQQQDKQEASAAPHEWGSDEDGVKL